MKVYYYKFKYQTFENEVKETWITHDISVAENFEEIEEEMEKFLKENKDYIDDTMELVEKDSIDFGEIFEQFVAKVDKHESKKFNEQDIIKNFSHLVKKL